MMISCVISTIIMIFGGKKLEGKLLVFEVNINIGLSVFI